MQLGTQRLGGRYWDDSKRRGGGAWRGEGEERGEERRRVRTPVGKPQERLSGCLPSKPTNLQCQRLGKYDASVIHLSIIMPAARPSKLTTKSNEIQEAM